MPKHKMQLDDGMLKGIWIRFAFLMMLCEVPILFSCSGNGKVDEDQTSLRDFNASRRAKGLPIIEDSWVIHWKDSTYCYWSNPENG